MTAYEELTSSGTCGGETIALMQRLGAQMTRTSSFPPPAGYQRWDADAVDDLLGEMFAKRGPVIVLGCFYKALDQPSLERLLLAAIRNFLIDQAKGTERGKLRRRLGNLLASDSRFTRVSGGLSGWRTTGTGQWQGDLADLHQAAASVRGINITRWNESGPTPKGTVAALTTVSCAVLDAAGAAVRDEDLARVLEARFALLAPPTFVALTTDEGWAEPAAPDDVKPQALAVAEQRAAELWRSLSVTERALFPHLGRPATEQGEVLGAGPKTARAIAEALGEKLRQATVDDEDRDEIVAILLQRCEAGS